MGWEVEEQNKLNLTINKRRSYNKAETNTFKKRKLDIEYLAYTNEYANKRKIFQVKIKINQLQL